MSTASLLGIASLIAVFGQNIGFSEFTERPEVPFEATTFEQDALVEEAEHMRGDSKEIEPVIACDALIADKTVPLKLRSWAVRQKIKLCTYAGREWEALDAGKAWLQGDGAKDPYALDIRVVMGQILAQRGHGGFVPMYEDAKEVFEDLFEHHRPDNDLVVRGYLNYCEFMYKRKEVYPDRYYEIVERALGVLKNALDKNLVDSDLRPRFESKLAELESAHAWRAQAKEAPKPKMTEKEYLEREKGWAEDVRLLRQYRIEKGWVDPNGPPQVEEFSSEDVRDSGFQEYKKKMKEKEK